jgi:sugar phosphate isomerase/epimerase
MPPPRPLSGWRSAVRLRCSRSSFVGASIVSGVAATRRLDGGPTRRAPEDGVWLAGHTFAFRALPLADALERLVDLGLDDVELWLGHARDDPAEARRVVESAGVNVCAVSAGGFYDSLDDSPVRAFELAAALGVDIVVMCVAPRLVHRLARLAPPSIRVAVENHWDQPLARSREVAAAIGTSRLEACLDTGHSLAAGEQPADAASGLGRRLAHVHLKEGRLPRPAERLLGRRLRRRFLGNPDPVMPGWGDLDVAALRKTLVQVRFDGCVTVEHEGDRPDQALAVLAARWEETL